IGRIEPELGSSDCAKVRTAAERLLSLVAEILEPAAPKPDAATPNVTEREPAAPKGTKLEPAALNIAEPEIVVASIALDVNPPSHLSRSRKAAPPAHLLVVDDNETNRDVLCRRLEREGYQVSTAGNGRQALEMVRAANFDLVLLDIMMPEID